MLRLATNIFGMTQVASGAANDQTRASALVQYQWNNDIINKNICILKIFNSYMTLDSKSQAFAL